MFAYPIPFLFRGEWAEETTNSRLNCEGGTTQSCLAGDLLAKNRWCRQPSSAKNNLSAVGGRTHRDIFRVCSLKGTDKYNSAPRFCCHASYSTTDTDYVMAHFSIYYGFVLLCATPGG